MPSAQINDQFLVDEHPDVIVADKGKGLAPIIFKGSVDFCGEAEIVVLPLIAETLTIEREE